MWAWLRRWTRHTRNLCRWRERDQQLDDEIRFHFAQEMQLRIERGESESEATVAVHRQFGSVAYVKETVRAVWVPTSLEQLLQDLRLGCRILTQSPGLTVVVATMLAFVIGGNTTLFSIAHGLITKPAPGVHAEGLVRVQLRRESQPQDPDRCCASFPEYQDFASQTRTVRLIAERKDRMTATFADASHAVLAAMVSPDYFETLGVSVTQGRTLLDSDRADVASALGVVVSHQVWQDYLHGIKDPLGQNLVLNGHAATIIGVAPSDFQGDAIGESTGLWLTLEPYVRLDGTARDLGDRSMRSLGLIGQLAQGVSLSVAQAEFDIVSSRLQAAYPDTSGDRRAILTRYSGLLPGTGITDRGPIFLAMLAVVTIVTVVLVCANVANLMLSRTLFRLRDVAVRKSLGASPFRIVRMLFVEGLVISAIAWLAACVFALWLSRALGLAVPPAMNQGHEVVLDLTPDWQVMAYAMAVAVCATVAFTLAPATLAWKQEPLRFLKAGGHGVVEDRSRTSRALVIIQLAFAVVLLTSAGLAYRSLSLISTLDLGFNTNNLLLATVNTAGAAISKDANGILLDRLREQLGAIPGVVSVSFRTSSPSEPVRSTYDSQPLRAETLRVGGQILRTLGVTPLAGHELADVAVQDEGGGVVISENLAKTLSPGGAAIGRTLLVGPARTPFAVAGIAPNGYFTGVQRGTPPQFIFRSLQRDPPAPGNVTFYIRHAADIRATAPAISRALRTIDPRVSIVYMRSVETDLEGLKWPGRFLTTVLIAFAAMSLMVAIVGQYAVIWFGVRRRTRDFGVRIALGASSEQIVRSVLGRGLRWTCFGLAAGFVLSGILGRVFRSVLFGVTPTDARTYVAVLCVLGSASLIACYMPARRAGRIEPIDAIREE
jgi:predicted permease